jgi:serine/threonine protein kinase
MPPEKFSADKQIIKAGDIFSLGVTMYELLTGDLPFGDNGGLTLKAGADVPNLPGNFSHELNRLLISCMAKDPWERPPAEKLEEAAIGFLRNGRWPQIGNETLKLDPAPPKAPETPGGGRKTQLIPQPEPERGSVGAAKEKPDNQYEPEIKINYTPLTIFLVLIAIGFVFIAYFYW